MPDCEPLFDNHNRILSVLAQLNEAHLNDIIDLLENKHNQRITRKVSKTITDENAKKIIASVKKMLKINEQMFKDLELKPQLLIDKRILISKISYLWSVITDHSSERLENYGELTDMQKVVVDNYINQLNKAVNELQELIS